MGWPITGRRAKDNVTTFHPYPKSSEFSEAPVAQEPSARARRFWVLLAWTSVAVVVLGNLYVAITAVAPRTPYDEVGVLQAARFLSGDGSTPQTLSLGYYPGAAFLMAPVWWFTQDPYNVYTASVGVNIALGAATIWPLTLVGRRLRLATSQAVVAASVVMLLPARTSLADYVLSEQALAFFVAWAAVAAFVVWEKPTQARMALFVLAVLAAYLTHARALLLVLVAAVWLILFLRRRVTTALGGLVMLTAGSVGVTSFANWLIGKLVIGGFQQGDGILERVTTLGGTFARVAFTQSWSQLAGSAGLIAIGAVVLTVRTYQQIRDERAVGPQGFLWGLGLGSALLSFVSWSLPASHFYGTAPRFDSWTYTRYIDPFIMTVVLVAMAAIINRVDRGIVVAAIVGSVAVIVPTLVWAIRVVPTWGSALGPGNNSGTYPYSQFRPTEPFELPLFPTFENDNRFWAIGTAVTLAVLLVVLLLRSRPAVLVVLVIGIIGFGSFQGNPTQTRDAPLQIERSIAQVENAADAPIDVNVALDCPVSSQLNVAVNWIGFWFASQQVNLLDSFEALPSGTDAVIACSDWRKDTDVPLIDGQSNYGFSVFVVDPEIAENLRDRGVTLVAGDDKLP